MLSLRRILQVSLAATFLAIPTATAHAQSAPAAPACEFVLGFKALHDLDPNDIGDCTDNQTFASNGDAQQHTTKGLMAWRKADNWTAFTNGYTTWINGPTGLVNRLNTGPFFPWEAQQAPAPAATAAPAPSNIPSNFDPSLIMTSVGNCVGQVIPTLKPLNTYAYVGIHVLDTGGAPIAGARVLVTADVIPGYWQMYDTDSNGNTNTAVVDTSLPKGTTVNLTVGASAGGCLVTTPASFTV
jgi:hypothetical protein